MATGSSPLPLLSPSPESHNYTDVGTVLITSPSHFASAVATTVAGPYEKASWTITSLTSSVPIGTVTSHKGGGELSLPSGAVSAPSLLSRHVAHTAGANCLLSCGSLIEKSIPHVSSPGSSAHAACSCPRVDS